MVAFEATFDGLADVLTTASISISSTSASSLAPTTSSPSLSLPLLLLLFTAEHAQSNVRPLIPPPSRRRRIRSGLGGGRAGDSGMLSHGDTSARGETGIGTARSVREAMRSRVGRVGL